MDLQDRELRPGASHHLMGEMISEAFANEHVLTVDASGAKYEVRDGKPVLIAEATVTVQSQPVEVFVKETKIASELKIEKIEEETEEKLQKQREEAARYAEKRQQATMQMVSDIKKKGEIAVAATAFRTREQEAENEKEIAMIQATSGMFAESVDAKVQEKLIRNAEAVQRARMESELAAAQEAESRRQTDAEQDLIHAKALEALENTASSATKSSAAFEQQLLEKRLAAENRHLAAERDHEKRKQMAQMTEEETILQMQLEFEEQERQRSLDFERQMQAKREKMRSELLQEEPIQTDEATKGDKKCVTF